MVACSLFALYLAVFRPSYLNQTDYLGALIFSQVLLAALWKFRERFFPLLVMVFLWAGVLLPLHGIWTSGRWYVLVVAALVGYVVYMKDRNHHFGAFHLIAFLCVLAALVSAVISAYPEQAVLKALSLLLLFLYAASGGRLAILGREDRFLARLLLGCELLVYATALCYFGLHLELFDNPNSLGAVMGVVAVPLMLWGVFVSEGRGQRRRRLFAFLLALFLLFFSLARAGIVAGVIACVLLCFVLHRHRALMKGTAAALALFALTIAVSPPRPDQGGSVAAVFLYKGHREEGVLGSRRTPWQRTLVVIQQHPWFGSGFGTSSTWARAGAVAEKYESAPQAIREHGNSYLAIIEWVGMLGVFPFFTLILLTVVNIGRVLAWTRRTRDALPAALPLAVIVAAGLIHAAFEDWLFAVGYYLCVFFWPLAFALVDLLPRSQPASELSPVWTAPYVPGFGVVAPHP